MSPEQATAEKDLTNRSDIYSLGSVLYEMLTGNPPHTGASAQQIIMKIVTDEAAPVTKLRKSVPPNVAAAVSKALEKLPADRFATAADFAAALGNSAFAISSAKGGVASAVRPARRTALLAAAALLAVLAALWGWLRPVPSGAGGRPWRVRITLPDSAQVRGSFGLSPDGSFLLYDGGNGVWVRGADAPEPVRVAGTDTMDGFPSISPDGRQVALVGSRTITVVPVNGGTPRVAADAHFGTVVGWTDNGHLLVPVAGGLVRVSTAGGVSRPFMTLDTAAGDLFPVEVSGLPNGGAVFSIVGTDTSNIAVVGPEGGKPIRLLTGLRAVFAPPGYLIVTRADGSIIAVPFDPWRRRITGAPVLLVSGLRTGAFTTVGSAAVSATGRLVYLAAGGAFTDPRDLVWVGRSGGVTPAAPGWAGLFMSVALSPDGRRAAVDEFRDNDEIIAVRDLSSGSVARVVVPLMQLNDPVFSPDGRWLYFAAQGVYRADPGGLTPPERVIAPKTQQPALAPDGSQLYFTKTIAGGTQLVRRALSGGMDIAVTPAGASSNLPRRPQVSPDGHWLAFFVTVSGHTEIHVRSTDPARSEEWPLGTVATGQASVRWAAAGNELYYVARDSMMAVRVITSQTFVAGAPRALFATSGLMSRFEVARDGRFLMIRSRRDLRTPTELVMLERWTDLLPR
jgi:serine/threonine-protein kinase